MPFTFHGWEGVVNKRADGTPILLRSRISILHDAVVAHGPTLSGVQDGLLEDPFGCKFDPAWVQCAAGATDTSKCLTGEETAVVEKYYDGPSDARGHHFTISGYALGSELQWGLPNSATPTIQRSAVEPEIVSTPVKLGRSAATARANPRIHSGSSSLSSKPLRLGNQG